jgi:hypothetical protein
VFGLVAIEPRNNRPPRSLKTAKWLNVLPGAGLGYIGQWDAAIPYLIFGVFGYLASVLSLGFSLFVVIIAGILADNKTRALFVEHDSPDILAGESFPAAISNAPPPPPSPPPVPGEPGKGLLWVNSERALAITTWRTLAFDGPHHFDAQRFLGAAPEQIVGSLTIDVDGAFEAFAGPAAETEADLKEVIQELDGRLRPLEGWRFS